MLNSVNYLSYFPPQAEEAYTVSFDAGFCRVEASDNEALVASVEKAGDRVLLTINPFEIHKNPFLMLMVALDYLFGHHPEMQTAVISGRAEFELDPILSKFIDAGYNIVLSRQQFYQVPNPWLATNSSTEEKIVTTNDRQHPLRPVLRTGTYYRRYVPEIEKTISFRTIDVEKDLALFHNWHNQTRVYDLWDLNKSVDELRAYILATLADKHLIPMIAEADGQPVGYFEVYWAAEDRIAPYYDYHAYDRGFHFLVGKSNFLGRKNTAALISSVMHLIFLDEARTENIVAEPRADNKKVLKYVQIVPGWKFIKEFDFPHKRAALLMAKRTDFFAEGAP